VTHDQVEAMTWSAPLRMDRLVEWH
jgi:hypothetical protein